MAIAEATIVPLGTGSTSVSKYVADCHKILQNDTRVKHQLTPMGTVLEGDLDVILEMVRKMHEVPFDNGAMRVITSIRIDDRRDLAASMSQKLRSVKEKLDT
ncbi:MTH1187 family thiamine-binding protein [Petroclostridium sp. X23]|uniref:MTH1187 family thiamine-binding protein n=1 Tax=Petroclostridium sp. X23 TaxID=3045146 RepID=UPI0024AE2261|nr:MTH1187 family thiamine-binding protein [Petroclostridium sp. X23]WHH58762.1 MTH1187 family thiamine-binding protein [Petroclostridium sp. X23]